MPPAPAAGQVADLYATWARGFNCWRAPNRPAVYLRPGRAPSSSPMVSALAARHLKAFEITAWNPMGQRAGADDNRRRNERLRADLDERRDLQMLWPSSGFDLDGWAEDGFVIWLRDDDDEQWVVDLAQRYAQGAVYRYRFQHDADGRVRLWRQTVPVALKTDSDSDPVEMVISSDPPNDDI